MKRIRKSISILLLAALISIMPVVAFAGGTAYVGYINTDGTLVCTKSFDAMIDRLDRGTRVLYWDCNKKNLVKIVTQSGEVGYIYDGAVSKVDDIKKSNICKTVGNDIYVYKMDKNGHLSKGWHITAGLPVVLSAVNGEWAKVRNLKGHVGYMKVANLKKVF